MFSIKKPKKIKILIFSYYWPPAGGAGVQRWVKFVKYLNLMGYDIHIVTPRKPSIPFKDDTLESEISPNISITKTNTLEPFSIFNFFLGQKGNRMGAGTTNLMGNTILNKIALFIRSNYFIPDARKGWNSFALKAGEDLLKKENFNLIITTGPPHSTHLIGMKLKKKYGIKWISDFRDPWTNIYYLKLFPLTNRSKERHRLLEMEVLKNSDHVITVSNQLKVDLQKKSSNVTILYNGYDKTDFENSKNKFEYYSSDLVMSYIGNFKPNQFFDGFLELIESSLQKNPHLKIKFIGPMDAKVENELKLIHHSDKIEFVGPVDHQKALKFMKMAAILLIIIPQGENEKGIITGKIYEYMASGKPILSIGPIDGDAASILNKVGSPFPMVEYEYTSKILEELDKIINNWNEGIRNYNYPGLELFSRQIQSEKLTELIEQIVDEK